MIEDELTKLLKYVQRIEQKLDSVAENMATKKDLNILTDAVDAFAKQSET